MNRWRPSTRPLILIALLLLAGAVVNVVVAWVLVGAPDFWMGERSQSQFRPSMGTRLPRDRSEPDRPPLLTIRWTGRVAPPPPHTVGWRGPGWTCYRSLGADDPLSWTAHRVDCGWPFHSLTFTSIRTERHPQDQHSLSLHPPDQLVPKGWFNEPRHRLPLSPIVLGFAANTLFYAIVVGAILALPLSFFPVRRRLRARRGRCPKCGYNLAGLEGAEGGAPCPECGARRRSPLPQAEGLERKEPGVERNPSGVERHPRKRTPKAMAA